MPLAKLAATASSLTVEKSPLMQKAHARFSQENMLPPRAGAIAGRKTQPRNNPRLQSRWISIKEERESLLFFMALFRVKLIL